MSLFNSIRSPVLGSGSGELSSTISTGQQIRLAERIALGGMSFNDIAKAIDSAEDLQALQWALSSGPISDSVRKNILMAIDHKLFPRFPGECVTVLGKALCSDKAEGKTKRLCAESLDRLIEQRIPIDRATQLGIQDIICSARDVYRNELRQTLHLRTLEQRADQLTALAADTKLLRRFSFARRQRVIYASKKSKFTVDYRSYRRGIAFPDGTFILQRRFECKGEEQIRLYLLPPQQYFRATVAAGKNCEHGGPAKDFEGALARQIITLKDPIPILNRERPWFEIRETQAAVGFEGDYPVDPAIRRLVRGFRGKLFQQAIALADQLQIGGIIFQPQYQDRHRPMEFLAVSSWELACLDRQRSKLPAIAGEFITYAERSPRYQRYFQQEGTDDYIVQFSRD